MNDEWIAGKNPILEALRAKHPINKIWVSEQSQRGSMKEVLQLAKEEGIIVQFVPKRKLDQLADGVSHQGVLARSQPMNMLI